MNPSPLAVRRLVASSGLLLLVLSCIVRSATPFHLAAAMRPRAPMSRMASRVKLRAAPIADSSAIGTKRPERLGVLFLNLGGPEKLDDVEGFLYNLFADPDIIRLPFGVRALQKPIAKYISTTRSVQARAAYESIGGGSPIVKYTREQAALVQKELVKRGWNASCYFAMRYWNPMTEEVMADIERDHIDSLVIVPLYPHYSLSTSGSSMKLLYKYFKSKPEVWESGRIAHTVIPYWFQRPGYVRAMSKIILHKLQEFTAEELKEGVDVLFSAHGVPQSYIGLGDMYQQHIEECMLALSDHIAEVLRSDKLPPCQENGKDPASLAAMQRLREALETKRLRFHLSYQSRVGPVEWLRPYTDDKIKEFGKKGVKNLAVVPIAFVSEHIETLEEIDGEYRELAHESGIKTWKRVAALNTDADFILDMASMVEESLQAPVMPLSEACVLRRTKENENIARSELNRELRYLNTTAFNDPISHVLGWRVGKVAGRIGNTLRGIVNMLF